MQDLIDLMTTLRFLKYGTYLTKSDYVSTEAKIFIAMLILLAVLQKLSINALQRRVN